MIIDYKDLVGKAVKFISLSGSAMFAGIDPTGVYRIVDVVFSSEDSKIIPLVKLEGRGLDDTKEVFFQFKDLKLTTEPYGKQKAGGSLRKRGLKH